MIRRANGKRNRGHSISNTCSSGFGRHAAHLEEAAPVQQLDVEDRLVARFRRCVQLQIHLVQFVLPCAGGHFHAQLDLRLHPLTI